MFTNLGLVHVDVYVECFVINIPLFTTNFVYLVLFSTKKKKIRNNVIKCNALILYRIDRKHIQLVDFFLSTFRYVYKSSEILFYHQSIIIDLLFFVFVLNLLEESE